MANEFETKETPKPQNESSETQAVQQKLNRIANKAAKRAAERQQRYDAEHSIFTK